MFFRLAAAMRKIGTPCHLICSKKSLQSSLDCKFLGKSISDFIIREKRIINYPTPPRFCTIFGKIFKENEKSQPLWLTFNDMCFDLNLNFQRKIPYSHQDILCFG